MSEKTLTYYDNFLDVGLINQINDYRDEIEGMPVWRTSSDWSPAIRRSTIPIPILELPDKFTSVIHKQLKETLGQTVWTSKNPASRSMLYVYPPGSYIAWHDDAQYEFASILCINSVWNMNWGGLHLYEDLEGLGIRAEVPTFNRCLINAGGVPHGVSIIAPDAPPRLVIITFGSQISSDKESAKRNEEAKIWREKYNVDYDCKVGVNDLLNQYLNKNIVILK